MKVEHEASQFQLLDGRKHVLQFLLPGVSIHGDVFQIDNYGQWVAAQCTLKDTFYQTQNRQAPISGPLVS